MAWAYFKNLGSSKIRLTLLGAYFTPRNYGMGTRFPLEGTELGFAPEGRETPISDRHAREGERAWVRGT
jgi:hypothetical protein